MRVINRICILLFSAAFAFSNPISTVLQHPLQHYDAALSEGQNNVSLQLFAELEELARIVDISYCIGVTGIQPPFQCASRCSEFSQFQLVDTWNTGPLMSDSCGYIAIDHSWPGRIILAFRGTYSLANTVADLSTIPQEYIPYPGNPEIENDHSEGPVLASLSRILKWNKWGFTPRLKRLEEGESPAGPKCKNCTVHTGFLTSWKHTRPLVLPHVEKLKEQFPSYALHLVGHSLGGAVAALAGLEFEVMGLHPTVTTFGEPRIGNQGLRLYLDKLFGLENSDPTPRNQSGDTNGGRFRRVTHIDDPVPLLPLTEWGFLMHSGEIYISKPDLFPTTSDLRICEGDEDPQCIADAEASEPFSSAQWTAIDREDHVVLDPRWGLPARYRAWQLLFAHRDYFWRLGLCVPGGNPFDWGREKYGKLQK